MIRKLLLVVLMLPLCAFLLPGTAAASPSYNANSLTKLMLTPSDLTGILGAVGVNETFPQTQDVPAATDDLVIVGRVFANDQSFIGINLLASPDGSLPSGDALKSIKDGSFLQDRMNAAFSNSVTEWEQAPFGIADDDSDVLASFAANVKGTAIHVIVDSQLKDNVLTFVYYASTGNGDEALSIIGALYGGQQAKLP